ncbi:MAG: hypothetical protein CMM25_01820 [Rhodospirillaceae bacterium]|nr:hypothetical protein [Rhodospirillaceae bacterium]
MTDTVPDSAHKMTAPDGEPLPVPPPVPRPYDPSDDMPQDMVAAINAKVDKEFKPRPAELNLDKDAMLPPNQSFSVISFVGPDCPQQHDKFCLKIKGCFESEDKAKDWVQKIHKMDPSFNLFIVETGAWLGPFPPEMDKIGNQQYVDEEINKIVNEHQKSQEASQQIHAERKQLLKSQPDVNKALEAQRLADEETKLANIDETLKSLEAEIEKYRQKKESQVEAVTAKAAELGLEPVLPKEKAEPEDGTGTDVDMPVIEEDGVEESKE